MNSKRGAGKFPSLSVGRDLLLSAPEIRFVGGSHVNYSPSLLLLLTWPRE